MADCDVVEPVRTIADQRKTAADEPAPASQMHARSAAHWSRTPWIHVRL